MLVCRLRIARTIGQVAALVNHCSRKILATWRNADVKLSPTDPGKAQKTLKLITRVRNRRRGVCPVRNHSLTAFVISKQRFTFKRTVYGPRILRADSVDCAIDVSLVSRFWSLRRQTFRDVVNLSLSFSAVNRICVWSFPPDFICRNFNSVVRVWCRKRRTPLQQVDGREQLNRPFQTIFGRLFWREPIPITR